MSPRGSVPSAALPHLWFVSSLAALQPAAAAAVLPSPASQPPRSAQVDNVVPPVARAATVLLWLLWLLWMLLPLLRLLLRWRRRRLLLLRLLWRLPLQLLLLRKAALCRRRKQRAVGARPSMRSGGLHGAARRRFLLQATLRLLQPWVRALVLLLL